jgi:hypothetical protein
MRGVSRFASAALAAAALMWLAGCARTQDQPAGRGGAEVVKMDTPIVADIEQRLAAYAPTRIGTDLGGLSASERAVLDRLVAAAAIMHEVFTEQALPDRAGCEAALASVRGPGAAAARAYFAINVGPWDRRFDSAPFLGDRPHPAGANFYPTDLTAAEKAAIGADPALGGLFTMVRRDAAGALKAVPYSEYFRAELTRAAGLLREAAGLTDNASLAAFLRARADAFLSDDYYESDMLWMDLDSRVEVTIGPYETYEDGLFGYKASFEAFVTVADPAESARLARFKDVLPWLEENLPLPAADRNPNRGSDSPIRVVDEVYTAGDTRTAVQTIAFNLPNDERVREAKGSKKVLLRNIMDAKFATILTPIAERLVVADQLGDLAAESFFLHTLWHEMSHGLGPGRIVKDGRETEVRLELKDLYSTIEEAKADAMGPWCIFRLQERGEFPSAIYREQAATYLAGLFRSVRFGIGEAHGQANALQFNFLLEKGVITDEGGKFRISYEAFPDAITQLVHALLTVEAAGDYDGAKALLDRYGVMPPVLAAALGKLDGVPVDILPRYDLGPR